MSQELEPVRASPMSLIQLAIEKGLAADQLGKLYDLQERWERNEATKAFCSAIQEFQRRMPPVIKGNPVRDRSGNLMYSFANYDDIMEIAQPIMSDLGIVATYTMVMEGALLKTTCRIRVGTHFEEATVPLGLPSIPNANDSQKAGAATSYGKRYAIKLALGIRVKGEDTDGNGLHQALTQEQVFELNDLFAECRKAGCAVDSEKFWKWIGCADMNEMKAADFERAKSELTRKLKGGKK